MSDPRVQLRLARASDLDAVIALERDTEHAPHWTLDAYSAILGRVTPQRCLYVAQTGERLSGFAVGLIHPAAEDAGERIAELESVVVAPDGRRAGIGRRLCTAVCDWCHSYGATEIVLEVRAASDGAIALYTHLGFSHIGRRPRYYRDPDDDALVMRRRLDPPGWQEESKGR